MLDSSPLIYHEPWPLPATPGYPAFILYLVRTRANLRTSIAHACREDDDPKLEPNQEGKLL